MTTEIRLTPAQTDRRMVGFSQSSFGRIRHAAVAAFTRVLLQSNFCAGGD